MIADEDQRDAFATLDESGISRRDKVYRAIMAEHPEPGMMVTTAMISDALGEPWPLRRSGVAADGRDYEERDYAPMVDVRRDLLLRDGIVLIAVDNEGYRVATEAEKIAVATERWGRAMRQMSDVACIFRSVRRAQVTHAEAQLAADGEQEARESLRVLRVARRGLTQRVRLGASADDE